VRLSRVTRQRRRALTCMTFDEALDWIQQVDGKLYQNPEKIDRDDEWVAVVRTPGTGRHGGKVIVAAGPTLQHATSSAAKQWDDLWLELSRIH
jgi:hypothetical protein